MLSGILNKLPLLAIVLTSHVFAEQSKYETAIIESYESDGGLRIEGENVDPANKLSLAAEDVKDGQKRLNLSYKLASPESFLVVGKRIPIAVRAYRFSVQVFGDGQGAQIGFLFEDGNGRSVRAPLGTVSFKGWKTLTTRYVSPSTAQTGKAYANSDNRAVWYFRMPVLYSPLVFRGIYLRSPRSVTGFLAFDKIELTGRFTPPELVDIALRPKNGTPYFWGAADKPAVGIELTAPGTVKADAELRVTLKDSSEKVIATVLKEAISVTGGQPLKKEIPLNVTRYGAYYLDCQFGEAVFTRSFCWLPAQAKPAPSNLGVSVDSDGLGPEIPLFLEAAKNMGASRVRFRFMWNVIEREAHTYVFPAEYDLAIESSLRLGLQPLVVIGDTNPLYDKGSFPVSDEAQKAFCDFGQAVARRYKGKVKQWEVFNAVNSSQANLQSPQPYMRLLESIYPLLRKEDPQCKVVGGGIYGIPFPYIEALMGTYMGSGMDVFSVQPTYYSSSPLYLEYYFQMYVSRLGSNLKAYGAGDLPVWLTSVFNQRAFRRSGSGKSSVTRFGDRVAASNFVRMTLASMPYDFCKAVYVHTLTDGPADRKSYINAIIESDGSPTAAYAAYNTMARALTGRQFDSALPITTGNSYPPFAYLFTGEAGPMLAAWTRTNAYTYNLKTDATALTVMDLMGNETTVKTWDGQVSMRLSNEPTFITGFKTVEIGTPLFGLAGPETVPAGLPVEMKLAVAEGFPNQGFDVNVPSGWQSKWTSPTAVTLTPPQSVKLGPLSVTVIPKNFPGMSSVGAVALIDGTKLSLSSSPSGLLSVLVNNPLPIPREAKLQVTAVVSDGEPKTLIEQTVPLPAGGSFTKTFPLKAEHPLGYSQARVEARLSTGRGGNNQQVLYVGDTPCYEMSKVVLDGNLNEWSGLKAAYADRRHQYNEVRDNWNGPEDLSVKFWTGWDTENFYVAAEVTDDVQKNPYSGFYLHYGDAIRFSVAGSELLSDFGVAKTDGGVIGSYEYYPTGAAAPDGLKAKVVRRNGKTYYETSVTWAQLKVNPAEKQNMKFSIAFVDGDERKVDGIMEWCNWPGWSSATRAVQHNPMIWLKGK